MQKSGLLISVLLVLLLFALVYILADYWDEMRASERVFFYQQGVYDTAISLYTQTANCQSTTINIGNLTREVVDVSCLEN